MMIFVGDPAELLKIVLKSTRIIRSSNENADKWILCSSCVDV
jgi:hypothetical protein